MMDALIKRFSVTYKCYEMYAYRGKKGATARVLRSIKKWNTSVLLTQTTLQSINCNNGISHF